MTTVWREELPPAEVNTPCHTWTHSWLTLGGISALIYLQSSSSTSQAAQSVSQTNMWCNQYRINLCLTAGLVFMLFYTELTFYCCAVFVESWFYHEGHLIRRWSHNYFRNVFSLPAYRRLVRFPWRHFLRHWVPLQCHFTTRRAP